MNKHRLYMIPKIKLNVMVKYCFNSDQVYFIVLIQPQTQALQYSKSDGLYPIAVGFSQL